VSAYIGWSKTTIWISYLIVWKPASDNNWFFFGKLKCQKSTMILSAGIKYSTRDLICDVNCCVWLAKNVIWIISVMDFGALLLHQFALASLSTPTSSLKRKFIQNFFLLSTPHMFSFSGFRCSYFIVYTNFSRIAAYSTLTDKSRIRSRDLTPTSNIPVFFRTQIWLKHFIALSEDFFMWFTDHSVAWAYFVGPSCCII